MVQDSWHSLSTEEVLAHLESRATGLTLAEAASRLVRYGPNEIEEEKRVSRLALLAAQLRNPLVAVLVVAALISLSLGDYKDVAIIAAVILTNTALGFAQEFKAEEALHALKVMAAPEAEVLRDCPDVGACLELRIKANEVVPGDVVRLDAGDRIPADARVLEAVNLEVDESMLTGESLPVRKTTDVLEREISVAQKRNMVFSGTTVTQGRGRAVVVATGMMTEMGRIARLIKETERADAPLTRHISRLSRTLAVVALAASTLIVALGLVQGFDLREVFLFALATAISAIPEGLPVVITVTLSVAVGRMVRRNVIIRKLPAVETLGSATAICTDKTGTLTTNQMTVQGIYVDGKRIGLTGVGFAPEGQFEVEGQRLEPTEDGPLALLLRIAVLCNDARLMRHEMDGEHRWEIYGDPTEGALVVAAAKGGLYKEQVEAGLPRIDEIPFNPQDRYMATFHQAPEGGMCAYVKGAPESVLAMSSRMLTDSGAESLSLQQREEIGQISSTMAGEALRVIALAYRAMDPQEMEELKGAIQGGHPELVLAGLAGMMDPARPEAKGAVKLCKQAGIGVVMATGDHKLTAEAIARELGILGEEGEALTGTDLNQMDDDELDEIVGHTSVFARVSPTHKFRVVESLRRRGHVVAMTGDGVNDAPALKAAEIGIAMGITGTDVTKETADMVLTDDNFASIVNAVEEGRVVFENIRKVVKYLISTSAGEILTILTSMVLLSRTIIFTPIQILWINLVTDGVLDITLAMEPREADVMDQPPRKRGERIINRDIFRNVLYVSIVMAVGTLWVFTRAWSHGDIVKARTVGFTTMAMFQVFNALNCRSRTRSAFDLGLLSNRYLVGAIVTSVILQLLANRLPLLQTVLGTTPISLGEWLTIILVSSSVFVIDEVRKFLGRRYRMPNLVN